MSQNDAGIDSNGPEIVALETGMDPTSPYSVYSDRTAFFFFLALRQAYK